MAEKRSSCATRFGPGLFIHKAQFVGSRRVANGRRLLGELCSGRGHLDFAANLWRLRGSSSGLARPFGSNLAEALAVNRPNSADCGDWIADGAGYESFSSVARSGGAARVATGGQICDADEIPRRRPIGSRSASYSGYSCNREYCDTGRQSLVESHRINRNHE